MQRVDPVAKTALVLRLSPEAYAAASFLDSRVLPLASDGFVMPHDHLVGWTQALTEPPRPIHFIFHAGHVGSTLLSRFVEEAGGVLSLREPPALKTLAKSHDALAPLSAEEFNLWLATQVRLWRRGYVDTRCVVLKATSDTQRLGPHLFQAAPEAKALLLNVCAEQYLATLLSAPSEVDIHTKAAERAGRLGRMLEAPAPAVQSRGEATAMSWLAERLTQQQLADAHPGRTLKLDFDEFLDDAAGRLGAVLQHFGLEAPAALLSDAAEHPLMKQYSKNPAAAYSAADRAERLSRSRRDNAEEIGRGLAWLSRLGRAYPSVAAGIPN